MQRRPRHVVALGQHVPVGLHRGERRVRRRVVLAGDEDLAGYVLLLDFSFPYC